MPESPSVPAAYHRARSRREANQVVEESRGVRNRLDPSRPYAVLVEEEAAPTGGSWTSHTIFLTNRTCPWRCVMCDLWKNTTSQRLAPGQVTEQVRWALAQGPEHPQVKLYNAGSFWDDRAIHPHDRSEIATLVRDYSRVVVECHPKLVGARIVPFAQAIDGTLEVAMGLETADPVVLAHLNKGMTIEDFREASSFLHQHEIDLRVFILLRPPYTSEEDTIPHARASVELAFDSGASMVAVIPTRPQNKVLATLGDVGHFSPPSLEQLEEIQEWGISMARGRFVVDTWDIERLYGDQPKILERKNILEHRNLAQNLGAL